MCWRTSPRCLKPSWIRCMCVAPGSQRWIYFSKIHLPFLMRVLYTCSLSYPIERGGYINHFVFKLYLSSHIRAFSFSLKVVTATLCAGDLLCSFPKSKTSWNMCFVGVNFQLSGPSLSPTELLMLLLIKRVWGWDHVFASKSGQVIHYVGVGERHIHASSFDRSLAWV